MKQFILLTILFFTITLFEYCSNSPAQPKGLKANFRDTALVTIDYNNWGIGLTGEYKRLTAGRIYDSATVFGNLDSVVNKDGTVTYSQSKKQGIDTIYFYLAQAWMSDTSRAVFSDSMPRTHKTIIPIRIEKQFVSEVGEIHMIRPYNPFTKPVEQPKKDSLPLIDTNSKKAPKK